MLNHGTGAGGESTAWVDGYSRGPDGVARTNNHLEVSKTCSAQSEIPKTILGVITESLPGGGEGVGSNSDPFEQRIDSMGMMQLILVLEEDFGVHLNPVDISRERFASVGAISALIQERQKTSGAAER